MKPTDKYIKRTYSLPVALFAFAEKESERIAKATGNKPNISGYLAQLLFAAKVAKAHQPTKPTT